MSRHFGNLLQVGVVLCAHSRWRCVVSNFTQTSGPGIDDMGEVIRGGEVFQLERHKSYFFSLKRKNLTFEDFICKIDFVFYKQCLNSLVINMHVCGVKSHFLHNALMEMAVL